MRFFVQELVLCAIALPAQEMTLKTTVPLVIAPTTVTGAGGRHVRGLTALDLVLSDNGVPQRIQVEELNEAVSLAIAVQTSASAAKVLEKVWKTASLYEPLVAGERGEAALIGFSSQVSLAQDFTSDLGQVTKALRALRPRGEGANTLDAVMLALDLLERRPAARRRVLFVIAEKRDRGSGVTLEEAVSHAQRANVTVYYLSYSPSLSQFTGQAYWEP